MKRHYAAPVTLLLLLSLLALSPLLAKDKKEANKTPGTEGTAWASAVEAKPLSQQVNKGLDWLVEQQLPCGGWGQGDESSQMRGSSRIKVSVSAVKSSARPITLAPGREIGKAVPVAKPVPPPKSTPAPKAIPVPIAAPVKQKAPPAPASIASVADTCIATLALVRSGSTPSEGKYSKPIRKAVQYLCGQIEEADKDSMYITKARGTRVQSKLGPFVDTFFAALLLPEVAGNMPNKKENKRVEAALVKVLTKMEKNQKEDGTWSNQGWAATLSQGVAVKGINRAGQISSKWAAAIEPATVKKFEKMRAKTEKNAQDSFDAKSGKFAAKGSAGVNLYSAGSGLAQLAENAKTNETQKKEAEEQANDVTAQPAVRAAAKQKLQRFEKVNNDLQQAQMAVVKKLDDAKFIAGFGNNGGEEFLSYMNIGESLVSKGGDNWKTWDKSITENLNRIQNKDGSWTGHHCITGRTFCTASALLVLMTDRAPAPVVAKMKKGR